MTPADLLSFEWEIGVFRAVRALWRRVAPGPAPVGPGAAHLDAHVARLRIVAQLVAGEAVRLLPARTAGGVRGRDLLVPAVIDVHPDAEVNAGLLLVRVVHAAAFRAVTRGRRPPVDPIEARLATFAAIDAAVDATGLDGFPAAWREACAHVLAHRAPSPPRAAAQEALVLAMLRGERPWRDPSAFRTARGDDPAPVPLWGAWLRADVEDDTTGLGPDDPRKPAAGTEREAPPVEELRRVLLDPDAQAEKVVVHSFEKIETLDNSEGNTMRDDGSDELDDHLEALEEVDLRDLVRGGQDAASIYKADVDLDADVPDVGRIAPGETGVPYDEWDQRARAYRKAWCTVYPTPVHAQRPAWGAAAADRHRRLIARLRDRLGAQRSQRQEIDRQLDGDHPDVDAMVDHLADVKAGHAGLGRLYLRHERQRRDVATTVLVDVSLSSDGWVDGRRVLDVARDAVVVLGEVADSLGDRLQVLAFASETRNRVRVFEVKRFDEPWALGRARLGALEPQGYTRIGPALRHATRGLAATPARDRVLLLLSDGKPNDYDKYEGRYGIADVHTALREAHRAGVLAHALAIDPSARAWLPAMFGLGHWHAMPHPDAMIDALTDVYGRCTGGRA